MGGRKGRGEVGGSCGYWKMWWGSDGVATGGEGGSKTGENSKGNVANVYKREDSF